MKTYIGTKIIQAEPCTEWEHCGYTVDDAETKNLPLNRNGYRIRYPDGYMSWSPADVFEAAYREISEAERNLI